MIENNVLKTELKIFKDRFNNLIINHVKIWKKSFYSDVYEKKMVTTILKNQAFKSENWQRWI